MKIRSLSFFVIFALCATSAFAKTDKHKSKAASTKVSSKAAAKKDSAADPKIESYDFNKLFAEAEKNFQIAKAWQKIKCQPKSGFICTKIECVKRDISTTLVLDKKHKTIMRCDGENCETFDAQFGQTGIFVNVQSEGPVGTLIRVFGDSRYKEITTVGLDAYIANGNCEIVAE